MIDKDELDELMRQDKEDEARRDNLDFQDECRKERENDKPDWDLNDGDYL